MGRIPSEFAVILDDLLGSPDLKVPTPTPHYTVETSTHQTIWQWSAPQPELKLAMDLRQVYKNHTPRPTPPILTVVKELPSRPERVVELAKIPKAARHAAEHLYQLAEQTCPTRLKEFEVRKLYRRLARRLHPDSKIGVAEQETARLADQFRGLKASYELLRLQFKA